MTPVEEALKMWDVFRGLTIAEAENIPEEKWDFRAGDGARTFREIVRHILETSVGFATELMRDEPKLARIFDPAAKAEFLAPYPETSSKSEAIEQLRAAGADVLKRLGESDLGSKTMEMQKQQQSRLSGLWFAIAHETYHRGQLASYARALGVVPAMTKQSQKSR